MHALFLKSWDGVHDKPLLVSHNMMCKWFDGVRRLTICKYFFRYFQRVRVLLYTGYDSCGATTQLEKDLTGAHMHFDAMRCDVISRYILYKSESMQQRRLSERLLCDQRLQETFSSCMVCS